MTALTPLDEPRPRPPAGRRPPPRRRSGWLGRPALARFGRVQLVVLALATIAPVVIAGAVVARLLGLTSTEEMLDLALAAGENPGMVTFGAMFVCSPVQWLTGRSQVRVRKYLGIVFFLLAASNGAMFAVESGVADALSEPFLVAGTLALLVALPLFLTSSRRAQRSLGMRRWRRLHRATYVVAAALVAHVLLLGDPGPGVALITLGTIARVPPVRRALTARGERRSPDGAAAPTTEPRRSST